MVNRREFLLGAVAVAAVPAAAVANEPYCCADMIERTLAGGVSIEGGTFHVLRPLRFPAQDGYGAMRNATITASGRPMPYVLWIEDGERMPPIHGCTFDTRACV